jgi:hypothetical protein
MRDQGIQCVTEFWEVRGITSLVHNIKSENRLQPNRKISPMYMNSRAFCDVRNGTLFHLYVILNVIVHI